MAWSARCDCYHNHNSASGRCNVRDVTDPSAGPGDPVLCKRCKAECKPPSGKRPLISWTPDEDSANG